jgi:serine/threonine protein kinase
MADCPRCHQIFPETQTTCPDDGEILIPTGALAGLRDLRRGDTVGEYVIEGKIGNGTFGDVYRAIQPLIGKQVAIKVLSQKYSADPGVVSRFIAEARAVNQIRHRNIIDIFSFGQLPDGRHYHIMELLQGTTLDGYLAHQGRLSVADALVVLEPLGRALDAAHACGIAHRDLKPANVFLAQEADGRPFPKLLDFGVAKLLSGDVPRHHQTATGAAIGTPDYMSPEQCQGTNVDHRTDVYAFGVMTYQLLTGRLPFAGESVVDVFVKQMHATPDPPSLVCPDLPAALDAPILAMLEKDRTRRPQRLAEAVRGLEEAARASGLEVPLTSATGDPLAPLPRVPSAPRGGWVAPMNTATGDGEARTLPSPSRSSESRVTTASSGQPARLVWAGAVGLLLLLPPTVWWLTRSPADEPRSEPRATAAPVAPAPEVRAAEAPDASVAPDAGPATVALSLTTTPPGAEVVSPEGAVLGRTPCTVRLQRGSEPVRLELRAPGYRTLVRELVPTADGLIDATLEKRPAGRPSPKRPKSDDLEDAF